MIPESFKNKAQLVLSLKKEEAALKQSGVGEALIAKYNKFHGRKDGRRRVGNRDIQK